MNKQDWITKFSDYYTNHTGIDNDLAMEAAEDWWNEMLAADMWDDPEAAAKENISYWSDDGGE